MNHPEHDLGISTIFVLALIVLLLTSCGSIQVDIENSSDLTPTPPQTEAPEKSGTPKPSDTPNPSSTPEPTTGPRSPIRIVFREGDTTWTREDYLNEGEINRFVLYALGGQIMSVYAKPFGMGLSIIGNDGSILKEKDEFRSFWRGELPATQDYILELDPTQSGVDQVSDRYTLSVVVNPLGELNQYFEYADSVGGFRLRYSDYFAIDRSPDISPIAKGDVILKLDFIGTEFYKDTNLSEAFIFFTISRDPDVVSSCSEPDSQEEVEGTVEVNGNSFLQSTFDGIAAGNIYQETIYRTDHDDACYEIFFWVHSNAIGAFPEGLVSEFDANRLLQLMGEVLHSFEFLQE
jgi:hypothetical protein